LQERQPTDRIADYNSAMLDNFLKLRGGFRSPVRWQCKR
jgi:hypothetical protein